VQAVKNNAQSSFGYYCTHCSEMRQIMKKKKRMGYILWIVLYCISLNAKVFEGKIGKYGVLMLIPDDSGYDKVYSYKGKLLDIGLVGDSYAKLCEYSSLDEDDRPVITACFEGTLKEGVYRGKWHKTGSRKSLHFQLKELPVPDHYEDPKDLYFYGELIQKQMKFQNIKKPRIINGIKIATPIETITKVAGYRVVLDDKTQCLFDLKTGKSVDLAGMFELYIDQNDTANKTFQDILKRYIKDVSRECYNYNMQNQHYVLYPTKNNMLSVWLVGMGSMWHACETEPIAFIPVKEMKVIAREEAFVYFDFKKSKIRER
jgi:hypothetical protein